MTIASEAALDEEVGSERFVASTYFIGGALFLAAGLLGLTITGPLSEPILRAIGDTGVYAALQPTGTLLFSAAILLVAIGLTREASVVARQPFGLVALAVLAALPALVWLVALFPALEVPAWLWDSSAVVQLLAGAVGTIEIWRIGVLPRWARWIPFVLFVVFAGLRVAYDVMMRMSVPMAWDAPGFLVLIYPTFIIMMIGPFVLGVVALVVGVQRSRRA